MLRPWNEMESPWKIGGRMLNLRSIQSESSQQSIITRYIKLNVLLLSLHKRVGSAYESESL